MGSVCTSYRSRNLDTKANLGFRSAVLVILSLTLYLAACGGGANSPMAVTAISIAPGIATIPAGTFQLFSAAVTGNSNTTVIWSVNGVQGGNAQSGTITSSGLYTAPASVTSQAITVTATAAASSSATASATVTISSPSSVASTLFGLNLHPEVLSGQISWPSFSFGSIRLWNSKTSWADLEPSNGGFDWTQLDGWLALGGSKGVTSFIYTFGKGTPQWASSNPNDASCTKTDTNPTPGQCDPPSDVDTGDGMFKSFVTALVQHAAGKIAAYECINEPNLASGWTGTMAQTLTMCTDMYNIVKANDPNALVTTPAPVDFNTQTAGNWMSPYLQMGGAKIADVIAFHGYGSSSLAQDPEEIVSILQGVATAIGNGAAVSAKPLWDTEMSWDQDSYLPDADSEAAFVARVYLLQWSHGVSRFYWFQYGSGDIGSLTTGSGQANPAGNAYGVVYNWMLGATLTQACTANGSVWTCTFKPLGGGQSEAVWDASQTCSNGTCTTSSFTPSSSYNQYVDLTGTAHPFSPGSTIEIGAKPILLQTQ